MSETTSLTSKRFPDSPRALIRPRHPGRAAKTSNSSRSPQEKPRREQRQNSQAFRRLAKKSHSGHQVHPTASRRRFRAPNLKTIQPRASAAVTDPSHFGKAKKNAPLAARQVHPTASRRRLRAPKISKQFSPTRTRKYRPNPFLESTSPLPGRPKFTPQQAEDAFARPNLKTIQPHTNAEVPPKSHFGTNQPTSWAAQVHPTANRRRLRAPNLKRIQSSRNTAVTGSIPHWKSSKTAPPRTPGSPHSKQKTLSHSPGSTRFESLPCKVTPLEVPGWISRNNAILP